MTVVTPLYRCECCKNKHAQSRNQDEVHKSRDIQKKSKTTPQKHYGSSI